MDQLRRQNETTHSFGRSESSKGRPKTSKNEYKKEIHEYKISKLIVCHTGWIVVDDFEKDVFFTFCGKMAIFLEKY